MKSEVLSKLWVVKFCLKVIYPKYNATLFFVYLAVKFRILHHKKQNSGKIMDTYKIYTVSQNIQKILVKQYLEDSLSVHLHKCLIISRNQFIQLASENLFYIDNGMLWVTLKLCSNDKKQEKICDNFYKLIKNNFSFMPSEMHKKLFTDIKVDSFKNRIVPIVGSKYVQENMVYTTEEELYNICSVFGLSAEDIDISFHPILSCDYAPKIAAIAEVSLIIMDVEIANDFVKEVLSNHFETPKLVHCNDILSIDLSPEMTTKYNYKYSDLIESAGRLYFTCKILNTDQDTENNIDQPFFIVKGVTQLTLGESAHKLKPKDEYFKLKDLSVENYSMLKLCPAGLKEKFEQIQETIKPFLVGEISNLATSLSSPIIPMLLLTGPLGSGRHLLVKTLSKFNGMNCLQIDCNALQSSTAKQTESKISATVQKAKTASPVIVLLDNFEVFAVDAENNEDCRIIEYFVNTLTDLYQNYTKHTIIFIAITERTDLKPNILRIFLDKFHIPKLNLKQRQDMLHWFTSVMNLNITNTKSEDLEINAIDLNKELCDLDSKSIEVYQRIAAKTETFIYGDIDTLVHLALRESYMKQLENYSETLCDPNMKSVSEEHFNLALESMRSLQSQNLDAPKIPKVFWEDIGGLDKLKKELLKTIEFPIKYPHLFKNSSLKRSGILLYGPPGCGKTLVAKAVSTELNVSFLSVKGPELLNMYIGQSEENVRRVFESARASSPCIVFLDELDALAARRGAAGDSGGAADRIVSQLLAELDGVNTAHDSDTTSFVFVMGATNRPDLVEQSLLRPGRLDKLIYVGPYCGLQEKTRVLQALCRSHNLRPEVNLETVAEALPERVTGADLLQVVSTARSSALRTLVNRLKSGGIKQSELSPDSVYIGVSDMQQGVALFRPSVTEEELAHYESLQMQM